MISAASSAGSSVWVRRVFQQDGALAHRGLRDHQVLPPRGDFGLGARELDAGQRADGDFVLRVVTELFRDRERLLPEFQLVARVHVVPVEVQDVHDEVEQLRPERSRARRRG